MGFFGDAFGVETDAAADADPANPARSPRLIATETIMRKNLRTKNPFSR
jgi:hypothetical protein